MMSAISEASWSGNSLRPTLVARLTSDFSAFWVFTSARTAAVTASGSRAITASEVMSAGMV